MKRHQLVIGLLVAALIALGGWLWSRQGMMVWLQDAIRTCF